MKRNGKMRTTGLFLAWAAAALLHASSPASAGGPPPRHPPAQALAATIERLQSFGTRFSGTSGSERAALYLAGRLENIGVETRMDTLVYLSGTWKRTFNVVGTIRGLTGNKVVLGAHFDSISLSSYVDSLSPAPGADDNGSGCAALIEAARLLAGGRYVNTIDLVFFGGEEVGRIGSLAYASDARARGDSIVAMISLDAIGFDADGIKDVEIIADTSSVDIALAALDSYRIAAEDVRALEVVDPYRLTSDHSAFWQNGYPAIHIYEGGYDTSPYHHTEGDTLGTLDLDFLAANSAAAAHLVKKLACAVEVPPPVSIRPGNPNPSPGMIEVPYTVQYDIRLRIEVFDVLGRRLATLFSGTTRAGERTVFWDGLDDSGTPVLSGVYLVSFTWNGGRETIKVTLIR